MSAEEWSRKVTRYVVNEREYSSLDEMPPEVRRLFDDQNRDGRPDCLETPLSRSLSYSTSESIELRTVNGVTTYRVGEVQYASLDEMPPEHRRLFEDRDRDGLPDGFPNLGRIASELAADGPPAPPDRRPRTAAPARENSSLRPGLAPTGEPHLHPNDAPGRLHADTVFLAIFGVLVVLVLALAVLLLRLFR